MLHCAADKVALAKKNILVVFDLETASWCSKITFKDQITYLSVLDSHGWIAVYSSISKLVTVCNLIFFLLLFNNINRVSQICQWVTAAKSRSFDVKEYLIDIHFVSEDLLLLVNNYGISFALS